MYNEAAHDHCADGRGPSPLASIPDRTVTLSSSAARSMAANH